MAIFQIVNGRCHWRTPFASLDETTGKFPPDCIFVDAPDYVNEQWGFDDTEIGDDRFIRPTPPEGWVYDDETGKMMPAEMEGQALEETKGAKQAENNAVFAKWLDDNPLTWTDGKQYGVTMADQQAIALNLTSYQIQAQAASTLSEEDQAMIAATTPLEWHAIHEACAPWTFEDLTALSIAIRKHIYPAYTLNQTYKSQIYACESRKDIEAINLDYSSLTPKKETEGEENTGGETPPAEETAPEETPAAE